MLSFMQNRPRSIDDWLRTPLGQRVYGLECKHVGEALAQVFGWQMLQIGLWGDDHGLIAEARTQQKSVLARHNQQIVPAMREGAAIVRSRVDSMAIASDSVVLREVERILMGEGHVIVLGFRPFSMWGTRHLFAGQGFPPGNERLLGERRVRDWLKLLGFEIVDAKRYLFTMPFGRAAPGTQPFLETIGERVWPLLAGAYLLKARKRVYAVTPIRLRWRARTGVVGGLVEPAARRDGGARRQ
jgi:hypothetical protein